MCNRRATEPNNTSRIVVISDFKCDAFVFEPEKPTTVATLLLPDSAKATSRARVHLTTSRAAICRNNDTQGTGNHATAHLCAENPARGIDGHKDARRRKPRHSGPRGGLP